jgi:DNA-binding Lrp family transcriptional regulator
MRLSEKERAVYRAMELAPLRSAKSVAEQLGYREHTVYHALLRLKEKSLFRPQPVLNMYMFGYMDFTFFFSLSAGKSLTERKVFISALSASSAVSWLGELGGRYHYGVSILARHVLGAKEVLDTAAQRSKALIVSRELSIRTGTNFFGRKYIFSSGIRESTMPPPIRYDSVASSFKLDEIYKVILRCLYTHSCPSDRSLATMTGIPAPTISRRRQRLEGNKVIAGYRNQVSAHQLGVNRYKIVLSCKGLDATLVKQLRRFCLVMPQVTHLIECCGGWDYEIGVELFEASEIVPISERLYDSFGDNINSLEVIPEFRGIRFESFPFDKKGKADKLSFCV